jgi:hypothetical protein
MPAADFDDYVRPKSISSQCNSDASSIADPQVSPATGLNHNLDYEVTT